MSTSYTPIAQVIKPESAALDRFDLAAESEGLAIARLNASHPRLDNPRTDHLPHCWDFQLYEQLHSARKKGDGGMVRAIEAEIRRRKVATR